MPKIYNYTKLEHVKHILGTNTIKVTHPRDFNDPFDCDIKIEEKDINRAISTIQEYVFIQEGLNTMANNPGKISKYCKLIKPLLEQEQALNSANKYYKSNPGIVSISNSTFNKAYKYKRIEKTVVFQQFKNTIIKSIYELRDKSLIGCFSKRSDSILMWSHYADKHKGVCIEFERPNEGFIDVKYSNKRVSFDIDYAVRLTLGHIMAKEDVDKNDEEKVEKLLAPYFTKFSDWQYEEEVRCVYLEKDNNVFSEIVKDKNTGKEIEVWFASINAPITKIIIGCNANKEALTDILAIAEIKSIPVEYCTPSDGEYKLIRN